jgi:hypothetical protein
VFIEAEGSNFMVAEEDFKITPPPTAMLTTPAETALAETTAATESPEDVTTAVTQSPEETTTQSPEDTTTAATESPEEITTTTTEPPTETTTPTAPVVDHTSSNADDPAATWDFFPPDNFTLTQNATFNTSSMPDSINF